MVRVAALGAPHSALRNADSALRNADSALCNADLALPHADSALRNADSALRNARPFSRPDSAPRKQLAPAFSSRSAAAPSASSTPSSPSPSSGTSASGSSAVAASASCPWPLFVPWWSKVPGATGKSLLREGGHLAFPAAWVRVVAGGGAFLALAASFRGIRWRCHGRCGGDDGDLGCGLCRRRTGRRGLLDLGRRRRGRLFGPSAFVMGWDRGSSHRGFGSGGIRLGGVGGAWGSGCGRLRRDVGRDLNVRYLRF